MTMNDFDLHRIPAPFHTAKHWVSYRVELDNKGRPTKRPYNPSNGKRASVRDPAAFSDFSTAHRASVARQHDGVGFVITKMLQIVLIDLDHCVKRITSKMAAGHAFILIDNRRRRLDSAALSSAITATTWEDRRLGATIISFSVTCMWRASGNNPALSLEMARRSVRIRLDAKIDRPWLREGFTYQDLLTWVATERAHLIWSALVLAQAWIANGRPTTSGKRLGMFEKWSEVVGGILHVAEIPGFLSNLDAFYEDSDWEGAEWRNFISAWSKKWGEVEVTVSNIFDLAENLALGSGNERSRKTKLGKMLADHKDRQFGDCRLKKGSAVDGSQRWKLESC